ncbi:MAG: hypothetical protein ACXVCY_04460 [Pseudobdellovibrionaceae bacterium]
MSTTPDLSAIKNRISKLVRIHGEDGNWNYDSYSHGMLNGMLMIESVVTGEKPNFRGPPEEWGETQYAIAKIEKSNQRIREIVLEAQNHCAAFGLQH